MDTFRISLIVVGITVLLGIYVFDSNKKLRLLIKNLQLKQLFSRNKQTENDYSQEPEIIDDPDVLQHIDEIEGIVAGYNSSSTTTDEKLTKEEQEIIELTDNISDSLGEELVIVFFILSRGENHFNGTDINEVCDSNGFEFNDNNIYEKFSDTNLKDKRPVASIVNSFEPGVFDSDFNSFETKAITLILILPGPDSEMKAFDDIIIRAKDIAKQLNGELCDETRSVLTQQTISHLIEKIEAFQFKNKMVRTSAQH
ncbi:MAG: cell division protein ZipA C-terminal FtsZ-binding domain-containing protein [Gammaproteobacteria bacterium]